MMTVLLESGGARTPRRTGWSVASLAAHSLLIACAIALTTHAPAAVGPGDAVVHRVIYDPVPLTPQQPTERPAGPTLHGAPTLPSLTIQVPTVPTFDVRPGIPSSPVDADAIFRRDAGPMTSGRAVSSDGVHTVGNVDRIAAPLPGNGAPDYPRTLRTAGVEGTVVVTFVVDTTGRAEPATLAILSTTHPLFADAVRHWIARTRYVPAEINGKRVRQLVQQEVGFTLRR